MNEIEMLRRQLLVLQRTRDHLLRRSPTDLVAASAVSERIVELSAVLTKQMGTEALRSLSRTQEDALLAAVSHLESALAANATVSAIMAAVSGLPGDPTTPPPDD